MAEPPEGLHHWSALEVAFFLGISVHGVKKLIERGELVGCWKKRHHRYHPGLKKSLCHYSWQIPDAAVRALLARRAARDQPKGLKAKATPLP